MSALYLTIISIAYMVAIVVFIIDVHHMTKKEVGATK